MKFDEKITIKNVSIIGLGALGVLYADYFTKKLGKDNVRILADKQRIVRYQKEGVYCNGKQCDFQYVDIEQNSQPADLLLFTVKYNGLASAIHAAKSSVGKNTIILSLLNGIRSELDLIDAYGIDKVLYCVAQKMDAVKEDNRLSYTHMGELAIGEADSSKSERLQRLIDFFDSISLPYSLPKDMKNHLWSKLLCNVGVNQTVMIYEGNYGTIQQEEKPRKDMIAAMYEVVKVANVQGIPLDEADVRYWTDVIDRLDPEGEPSMRQDGKARRASEVELFAGTICRLGKEYGIATPMNDMFYRKIKEMESKYHNQ